MALSVSVVEGAGAPGDGLGRVAVQPGQRAQLGAARLQRGRRAREAQQRRRHGRLARQGQHAPRHAAQRRQQGRRLLLRCGNGHAEGY